MTPPVSMLDVSATEEFGAVQVVNHGVPQHLVADLGARAGRLLSRPRAEKAMLASPHPYRGWRQWPDDFGRLELELTVNDYPTWTYPETAADEDKLLLLEHADDSAVTVLAQQGDYEGLQVQGPGGRWIPVPVIPGALQVFSGQLLARWTGGRLRPGRHRVVAGGTVTRRSMAVFVYPALETVIDGVRVWDHVKDRVADYLAEYGRPDQVAAWRVGRPYVAELAENSAGQ